MTTQPVLVIGAAHLDIVGEYTKAVANDVDKPGQIIYSVGGTAYNIAANLAHNGVPVRFLTQLREASLVQPIIMARLAGHGIDTTFVHVDPGARESGFVAQRRDGDLITAVSASTMDEFTCPEARLQEAMTDTAFVVADCNLSAAMLNRVQKAAVAMGKRLVVAGVSQSKARRTQQIDRRPGHPFPIFAMAINATEAGHLGAPSQPDITAHQAVDVCRKLGVETLIITLGAEGFFAINNAGEKIKRPAPDVHDIVSATGAGDALLSGFCICLHANGAVDWSPDTVRTIDRVVSEVLAQKGGTVGAETRPDELRVMPRAELERLRALERDHLFELLGKPMNIFGKKIPFSELATVVGIVIAVLALANDMFGSQIRDALSGAGRAPPAAAAPAPPPGAPVSAS